MNTSSSDAGTVRIASGRSPARSKRLGRPLSFPRQGSAPSRRTCARSPNACTSRTPCSGASSSSGGLAPSIDTSRSCPAACLQRGRTVDREQTPFVQQRHPPAALRLVEIRRRHDDRQPARQELGQQLPELAPRHRIDAGGRLVEQQHLRCVHQRACQRQLLLHAARQQVGTARAERRRAASSRGADRASRRYRFTPWISAKKPMFSSIVRSPYRREALREVTDVRGDGAVLAAPDHGRARAPCRRRPEQSAREPDRRRLAGAVRTDEAEHLPRRDLERQAVQRARSLHIVSDDAIKAHGCGRHRVLALLRQFGLDRHPRLQHAVAVVDRDLDPIHEPRPLLGGLHVARRELGRGEMKVIVPASRCPASVTSVTFCPTRSRGTTRLVDVHVRPRPTEVGDDNDRCPRARRFRRGRPAST